MKQTLHFALATMLTISVLFTSCSNGSKNLQGSESVFKSEQYNNNQPKKAVAAEQPQTVKQAPVAIAQNPVLTEEKTIETPKQEVTKQQESKKLATGKKLNIRKKAGEIANAYMPKKLFGKAITEEGKMNTMALISLIAGGLGILGGWAIPIVFSIAAIVFGIIAMGQIKKTGETGKGMAIAGIVLGALGIIGGILYVIFVGAYFIFYILFLLGLTAASEY